MDKPLPAATRPDKSHVVVGTLSEGNEIVLYVRPEHRNAWKAPAFAPALGLFISRGVPVYVSCNDQVERIF